MKNLFLLTCVSFLFYVTLGWAQQADSSKTTLTVGGYLETYYAYDFSQPDTHQRPFFYSFHRHNEVNLNIGLVQLSLSHERFRGNFALMAGTYSNANLVAESGVIKNIFEANAGVKLSKEYELWIDAGIFSSHIGFESAIGQDCWMLSRSLLAENSPYYESGVKISYTSPNKKWLLSGLLLNGWQRIQRIEANQSLAFGHQLTYTPTESITFTSSSFIGNDYPQEEKRMRYFHNFFTKLQFSPKFGLILGLDYGVEQKEKESSNYFTWYAPIAVIRLGLSDNVNLAARAEYFADKNQVIITTDTPNGFQTLGYSLSFDYLIAQNIVWRVEGRYLASKDPIFEYANNKSQTNAIITTSLSLRF